MASSEPTNLSEIRAYLARQLYCPGVVDVTAWAERHYDGGIARLSIVASSWATS